MFPYVEAKPGKLKTIYKVEPVESFFNFFKDCDPAQKPLNISREKDGEDSCEESEVDEEIYYIEEEYDLGLFIKDELIPYSIEYYLNLVEEDPLDDDDEEEVEDEEG